MQRIVKRTITYLLMGILTASITGCGKSGKGGTSEIIDENAYVYMPEYITLPSGENTYLGDVYCLDNKLYYSVNQYNEVNQESSETIYCLNLENADSEPQVYRNLSSGISEDGSQNYTMKRIITNDDSIISVEQKYPAMDDSGI